MDLTGGDLEIHLGLSDPYGFVSAEMLLVALYGWGQSPFGAVGSVAEWQSGRAAERPLTLLEECRCSIPGLPVFYVHFLYPHRTTLCLTGVNGPRL